MLWGVLLLMGVRPEAWLLATFTPSSVNVQTLVLVWVLYLVRGVTFFPATFLAVLSGWLFGPWRGLAVALVGVAMSVAITYVLARRLVRSAFTPQVEQPGDRWSRFRETLRTQTFSAVLFARLMSLPGDAVNLMAGAMRVPFGPFLLATMLGGLPSLVAVTWAGASIDGALVMGGDVTSLRWLTLSLALLGLAGAASLWLRRREPIPAPNRRA